MHLLKRLGLRGRHFVASRKQQATIQIHVGARDECTIIASQKQHKVCRIIDMALTSKEATGVSYIDHQALLQALWGAMRSQLSLHLDRLTSRIEAIYTTHNACFND